MYVLSVAFYDEILREFVQISAIMFILCGNYPFCFHSYLTCLVCLAIIKKVVRRNEHAQECIHLFQIKEKWNSTENLHSIQWLAITRDDLWHCRAFAKIHTFFSTSSSFLNSSLSFFIVFLFKFSLWNHKQLGLKKQVVALSLQKTFTQFMRLLHLFHFLCLN